MPTPAAIVRLAAALFVFIGASKAMAVESKAKRQFSLEWEPSEGASAYEIEIESVPPAASGSIRQKVDTPAWASELSPGGYRLRVRAIDERKVPGPWGAWRPFDVQYPLVPPLKPAVKAVVDAKSQEKEDVTFAWEAVCDDCEYHLEVTDLKNAIVAKQTTRETEVQVALPVAAHYRWQVIAKGTNGASGESPKKRPYFTLRGAPLAAPEITTPVDDKKRSMAWSAPANANHYEIKVEMREDANWKTLVQRKRYRKTSLRMLKKWGHGNYRLTVIARAPLWQASEPLEYVFELKAPGHEQKPAVADKTAKKEIVETGALIFSYGPMYQRYEVGKQNLKLNFQLLFLNSEMVEGYYWMGEGRRFGLFGRAHFASGELTSAAEENAGNDNVELSLFNTSLHGAYRWTFGPLAMAATLGVLRHDAYSFNAAPLSTQYNAEKSTHLDATIGASGVMAFGDGYKLDGAIVTSAPLLETGSGLKLLNYLATRVGFSHWIEGGPAFITYFYLYEFAKYALPKDAITSDNYSINSRAYTIGVSLGFMFQHEK